METIAVYWESKIRIYGITLQPGLVLLKLSYPNKCGSFWSDRLRDLQSVANRFYMVTAQQIGTKTLQLSLLVDQNVADDCRQFLEKAVKKEGQSSFSANENVELIYLHGPHFQDRYGIADAAFTLLQKKDFSLLASGCTGTSVHLVVPAPIAQEVAQCLGETFVVPPPDAG